MIDFTYKSPGSKTAHFSQVLISFLTVLSAAIKYGRRRQYLKPSGRT